MKKLIAVAVIFVCVGAALSAQINFSAGGGLLYDFSAGNGQKETDDKDYEKDYTNITSIGAFGFFDATYVEADVYFAIGISKGKDKTYTDGKDGDTTIISYNGSGRVVQLGASILGKYPVQLSKQLTVFPLAGISYNMVLSSKDTNGDDVVKKDAKYANGDEIKTSHFSQLGFLAGAGADYNINRNLFLRTEALLHLRMPSKYNTEEVKAYDDSDIKATWGFGPQFKLALGYRF